ncbi:spore maturation protein [Niabella ginsenosidivorans]|uniref:Spore maturation protein n=1 Tax=Niabella ginsenosidivorans TaxID=1176587 RepID=A0A1A9HZX9_9BACT|nr:nucleoside recognition domain-containing protein [Niabella ginsenosidivorans]ANH79982.1 spore maturation protein [Niabella ginsenosidivorans]
MVLSRIWSAFILIALTVALGRFLFQPGQEQIFSQLVTGKGGDTLVSRQATAQAIPATVQSRISASHPVANWNGLNVAKNADGTFLVFQLQGTNGVFDTTRDAVNLCIGLIGIMALFMGFMNIAEKAGGIRFLSRIIGPFFSKIFPDVPKDHPAMGHMVMNYSANLLGLDNAATPFGIKSMESLQELNPSKETASNAQIMFLCLHASGLTLIPTVIIADRVTLKSQFPTEVFIPCMIATFVATIAALFIVAARQKIKVFQPVIILWVMGITAVFTALILYVRVLDAKGVQLFSTTLSNGLILLIFLLIILGAIYKKTAIFDDFIDGAKGGFETSVRIIPYLVGLLIAISMLRNSGAFDFVMDGIKYVFHLCGGDPRIVDALPTALLKPFSGSGARAMMIDTLKTHGPDSFVGNLTSVFRGAADTTFYIIAVYFGAVGIKNTRYSVGAMLLADLAGVLTAIAVSYLFFK